MTTTYDTLQVDIGNAPNDDQGDPLRTAFDKINQRFAELRVFLNNRGDWAPNTAYTANPNRDWVIVDGVGYLATSNHTSGATFAADLAAGKWVEADALLAIAEVDTLRADLASTAAGKGASLVKFIQSFNGAVARWVQDKLREFTSADDFGAVGDDVADDTAKLQALFNAGAGRLVKLRHGAVYKCTSGLIVKGDVDGQGATLKFYGAAIASLVYQNTQGSLRNFTIDGTNVTSCSRGLEVNTDFDQAGWCYYDMTIKNISNNNSAQPAEGASFYRFSSSPRTTGFFDIKINVTNVTATANGVIGDTPGAAMGIGFGCNGSGTNMNVVIHDCVVKNVSPAEDAIGIYLLTGDHTSSTAKGIFTIQDCEVYDSAKYAYKIQAPNAVLRRCLADNANAALSETFTTYGHYTTFENCTVRNQKGEGFSIHGPNTAMRNCVVSGNSNANAVRLYTEANGFNANGLTINTTATFAGNDFARLAIDAVSRCYFDNVRIIGTTSTGTAIILTGGGRAFFSNLLVDGFYYGVQLPYSSMTTWWDQVDITATTCFYKLGNAASFIRVRDSRIVASSIAFLLSSAAGANAAVVDCDGSLIIAGTHGFLTPDGSRITNCTIQSANTTGYAVGAGNSVVRNNQITKFSVGVGVAYTTTAELANNVTIGTSTPYERIGYTAFVDHNNNSR